MKEKKTKIFLTGATGVMGTAGLKELSLFPNKYSVTVLARDSRKNRKKLKSYENKGVKVIWGDLLDEEKLKEGIETADIVLHVGGMVSPIADFYPEETLKVNVGSMKLISDIVKEIEKRDIERVIKVVYIGSVSQYGSNNPPNHWGNANNKQHAVKNDAYAQSKILAEKILREAGLKKWLSIRQTSILHVGLLKNANNPVAFHVPLNGVLEWITTEDSGRLLERICRDSLPEDFWCKCYNAGGGEPFRLTNIEFERGLLKAMGCPPPEKIFEPHWFATENFHGMWFEDSDELDSILNFRREDTYEKALKRMKRELPWYFKLTPLVPSVLIKYFMKRVASRPVLGPLYWIKNNDTEKINIAWGSKEAYSNIRSWDKFEENVLSKIPPKESFLKNEEK